MSMASLTAPQAIGIACAGLASLVLLVPLRRLLSTYAKTHINDDQWVMPALAVVAPLWLLLMGALLCVTVSGGFDWLRLGRPALYTLTVAASLALGAVTFVFVATFIRPGFTPRALYRPVITLVPLATIVLVIVSLTPQLLPVLPVQWVRWPWTIGAAVSMVGSCGLLVYWVRRVGRRGLAEIAHRLRQRSASSPELLAQVSALDPEAHFEDLLRRANKDERREVRDAAAARLRSHPGFLGRLCAELLTGSVEPAMGFLRDATLTPDEQVRLAKPARAALRRWVDHIPEPNYMTAQHRNALRRWGADVLHVIQERFAGSGVDFAPVIADFMQKVDTSRAGSERTR